MGFQCSVARISRADIAIALAAMLFKSRRKMSGKWKNQLYFGDNLKLLPKHVPPGTVDLVYLDPPFNSNANYNILFKERTNESTAQIKAFEDTWHWGPEAQAAYDWLATQGPPRLSELIQAFRSFLGEKTDMMAYAVMMAPRLVELRHALKDTGSIYLHCDHTASHYPKLIMDAIFGPVNFRSQITWQRTNAHSDSKDWSDVADVILYYVKDYREEFTWNPQHVPHSEEYLASKYRYDDNDGRGLYRLDNMTSPNPRPNMMYDWKGYPYPPMGWRYSTETMAKLDSEGRIWYPDEMSKRPQLKRYLNEMSGTLVTNIWTDIDPINSQAKERLGYPTQKPEALLERIIKTSSNDGDVGP